MTGSPLLLSQTGTSCFAFPNLCLSFHTDYIPHQLKHLLDCFQINKIWLYQLGSSIFYITRWDKTKNTQLHSFVVSMCQEIGYGLGRRVVSTFICSFNKFPVRNLYHNLCVNSLIKGKIITIPACIESKLFILRSQVIQTLEI